MNKSRRILSNPFDAPFFSIFNRNKFQINHFIKSLLGYFKMQNPGHVFPLLPALQYGFNYHLHGLRSQNTQDTGELQRIQIHWIYHVHHLHYLVSVHPYLLRNWKFVRGKLRKMWPNSIFTFLQVNNGRFKPIRRNGMK